jgi:3-oxoacyl-[acyl-carrier protein] reductase
MRLQGKTAIVTGAAKGIGRAIAELFAKESAQVVICDIDVSNGERVASLIQSQGGDAVFVRCDVSQEDQVQNLIQSTVDHYGRLDILINNAARWEQGGYLLEIDEKTWSYVIDGSLRSVYLCSRCAIPHMVTRKWGSIVNISSVNGLFGVNLPAYTAAKGGVIALTRIIAVQYGSQGIRANVICPGTIETEAVAVEFNENPEVRERFLKPVPIRRFGRPVDVAYCALYLASPESDFVTGATLVIDGGLTAGTGIDLEG